eukprot:3092130-Prymnesium_polylepis.1
MQARRGLLHERVRVGKLHKHRMVGAVLQAIDAGAARADREQCDEAGVVVAEAVEQRALRHTRVAAVDAHAVPRARRRAAAATAAAVGLCTEPLADSILEQIHHLLMVREHHQLARPLAVVKRVHR